MGNNIEIRKAISRCSQELTRLDEKQKEYLDGFITAQEYEPYRVRRNELRREIEQYKKFL